MGGVFFFCSCGKEEVGGRGKRMSVILDLWNVGDSEILCLVGRWVEKIRVWISRVILIWGFVGGGRSCEKEE